MNSKALETISHFLLFALLVFVIFWRGGKGIEATWLLTGAAGVAVLIQAWIRRKDGGGAEVPAFVWTAGVAFFLWTVLSYVFSRTQNYGLDEVLRDGSLLLLLFWIVRWQKKEGSLSPFLDRFFRLLVWFTAAASIVGLAVYVLQPVNRFVGTFFYVGAVTDYWPNAWAEFVLLTWPVILWWALRGRAGKNRALRFLLLGFVIGCLFLSYSRGGVIAFAGQVVLLALVRLPAVRGMRWRTALGDAALVAVMAIGVFFGANALRGQFHDVESIGRKVTFTAAEGASSLTERTAFYRQAWELSLRHPFVGWGPYSFRFVQTRLQEDVTVTSDHPHNVFLKVAVERGWPAALLLALLAAAILLPAARRSFAERTAEGSVTPFLLTAAAGVLAHNLIDFNLQFVAIAYPGVVLLGALLPASARTASRGSTARRRMEIALAVFLLLAAFVEGVFLVTSSLGRHAEVAGRTDAAVSWYARSQRQFFDRDLRLSQAHILLERQNFTGAEQAMLTYVRRNPEDARGWKLLGEIHTTLFRYPEARRDYEQAFVLNRYNDPGAAVDYLMALARTGDGTDVEAAREETVHLVRAYADAIIRNTHFIAISPRVKDVAELVRIASILYPQHKEELERLGGQGLIQAERTRERFENSQAGYLW
ncbi:MAG: O-antigen ligase family protein [Candidatus Peribacteraceae bacterium]|nr:O-antigen ligase family protein [Candidatus Peribacteraceae bacterium]